MTRPASAYLACTSFIDDEIEADWVNDEEDIKAMRVVLASKFSDDNPAFRDLLLATGDKDLYVRGSRPGRTTRSGSSGRTSRTSRRVAWGSTATS